MAHKIQIKRGNKADLPVLNDGEMGLCVDTQEVFVGSNGTNIPVGVQTEIVNNLTETVTGKALDATQGKVLNDLVSTMMIKFTNVTVLTTAFVSDTTYTEFPFKVDIACNGVTVDYIPEIYFDVADAIGGNYAPVALSGTNKVTIYAVEVPTANLTIPTIKCTKAVN